MPAPAPPGGSVAGLDDELAAAVLHPGFWPSGPGPVQVRHTHASVVLLCGDRAWKLRKPVRFPFLDYTTPALRHAAAREEVRVNARLAPGVYLGVRPVVRTADGLQVGAPGTAPTGTIDHVVEMRRFAERDTLAVRLDEDRVTDAQLAELGHVLAAFHAGAEGAGDDVSSGAAALLARLHRNTEDLLALGAAGPGPEVLGPLGRTLDTAVLRDAAVHDARAAAGRRRDGHGDLRADHVVYDDAGLRIVDRLEFDRGLRCDDVASDLAYLLMDLEARDAPAAARRVLAAYRAAGGDAGDDRVLAVWTAYRALVAAKIAWLRAVQGDDVAAGVARARLELAGRCAWRTRLPLVLVCCGAPATGKSTLAAALAGRSRLPVISSDHLRKTAHGVRAGQRAPAAAYAPDVSLALYEQLGRHAAAQVAAGGGAIVDATMRGGALRAAFATGLGGAAPAVMVQCHTPVAEARRRAQARLADPAAESDAGPEVAVALAATFEPLDEVAPERHLSVRGDLPTAAAVEQVEAALDALALAGRPGR